jgi:hypothetical protein
VLELEAVGREEVLLITWSLVMTRETWPLVILLLMKSWREDGEHSNRSQSFLIQIPYGQQERGGGAERERERKPGRRRRHLARGAV